MEPEEETGSEEGSSIQGHGEEASAQGSDLMAPRARNSPRAISREEMSGCGCTRSILDDPPLVGDFAISWESKAEYEEEVERSEKKK